MDIRVIAIPFDGTFEEFSYGLDATRDAVLAEADEIILVTDDPSWLKCALIGYVLGITPDEMNERVIKNPNDPELVEALHWIEDRFRVMNSTTM